MYRADQSLLAFEAMHRPGMPAEPGVVHFSLLALGWTGRLLPPCFDADNLRTESPCLQLVLGPRRRHTTQSSDALDAA